METLSATSVTVTGRPNTAGAIRRTAADLAAPPVTMIRLPVAGWWCRGIQFLLHHLQPVREAPQDPLDARPSNVGRGEIAQRDADQLAGRVWQRRRALTLEVGHESQALAAGGALSARPANSSELTFSREAVPAMVRAALRWVEESTPATRLIGISPAGNV
jgi:hypothetical protein